MADALSETGHDVTILDQCESLYLRPDQKMIVGDLMDRNLVNHLVQDCEVVYHFSGIAGVDECARRPVDTVRVNVFGTVHLLEACRPADIKRFVFASFAYVLAMRVFVTAAVSRHVNLS